MRIEEVIERHIDETVGYTNMSPLNQMPALSGLMRTTMTLNTVDPMPFWMFGGILAPMQQPPNAMVKILQRMEKGALPYKTKLDYRQRNLLEQAATDGLIEQAELGWVLTAKGRKLLDSFGNALGSLLNTVPHFHIVPAPLVTYW